MVKRKANRRRNNPTAGGPDDMHQLTLDIISGVLSGLIVLAIQYLLGI